MMERGREDRPTTRESEIILNKHPGNSSSFRIHYPSPAFPTAPPPRLSPVLFAHKLVDKRRAALALDVAAPVELAVAALVLVHLELVVASAAAHELAAVHALRRLIAVAALRAQRACALVAVAVVGTRVDVDQVLRGRGVEALVHQLQLALEGEAIEVR